MDDTPVTFSGTVENMAGTIPEGTTPLFSQVRAIDINNWRITTAPLAIDGSYTVTLPPGQYLISAKVVTDTTIIRAKAQGITMVAHYLGTTDISLVADPPLVLPSALSAVVPVAQKISPASLSSSTPECPGIPKPGVLIFWNKENHPPEMSEAESELIYELLASRIATGAPDVSFVSTEDLGTLLQWDIVRVTLSTDPDASRLDEYIRRTGTEFSLHLKLAGSLQSISVIRAQVFKNINAETDAILLREETELFNDDVDNVYTIAERITDGLAALLETSRSRPVLPQLRLSVSDEVVAPGGMVQATVTLLEADCEPIPDVSLFIEHQGADGIPASAHGYTDASGQFRGSFASGTIEGVASVHAEFDNCKSEVVTYRVGDTNSEFYLTFEGNATVVPIGDSVETCVTLIEGGVPVNNASIDLSIINGSTTLSSVTTDADGTACFDLFADDTFGVAKITATYGTGATALETSAAILVEGSYFLSVSASPTTVGPLGLSVITAKLSKIGGGAAGTTVSFSLDGEGMLSPVSGTTNGNGEVSVNYQGPESDSGTATITVIATAGGSTLNAAVDVSYTPTEDGECNCIVEVGDMAWDMNNNGDVVGARYADTYDPYGEREPFVRVAGSDVDVPLETFCDSGVAAMGYPKAINNNGELLVHVREVRDMALLNFTDSLYYCKDGVATRLHQYPDDTHHAEVGGGLASNRLIDDGGTLLNTNFPDINDSGRIVNGKLLWSSPQSGFSIIKDQLPGTDAYCGFQETGCATSVCATVSGCTQNCMSFTPCRIHNNGTVIGYVRNDEYYIEAEFDCSMWTPEENRSTSGYQAYAASLSTGYSVATQGPVLLNNDDVSMTSQTNGINDAGDLAVTVGVYDYQEEGWPRSESRAYRVRAGANELICVGVAQDINNSGHVVGSYYDYTIGSYGDNWNFIYPPASAYVYDGQMLDLNTLLPADSPWTLNHAIRINDNGLILGIGTLNGIGKAWLMDPSKCR